MLDIIAISRSEAKVTVLERKAGWTQNDVSRIVAGGHIVNQLKSKPSFLTVRMPLDKQTAERLLGFSDFDCKTVTGLNNPELPFAVPEL